MLLLFIVYPSIPVQTLIFSTFNLQYYNDIMVSLCCSLKFYLALQRVLLLSHMLVLWNFKVFVLAAVPAFLDSNFMIETSFHHSCMFWSGVSCYYKFQSSTYLSGAFQLKDSFLELLYHDCICMPLLHWSCWYLMVTLNLLLSAA